MIYVYILVVALSTYLIRLIPLLLCNKKITNRFIKSFLFYVPYTCLAAMTVPSIFFATRSPLSALIGFLLAVIVSIKSKNLIVVASLSCLAVFISELFIL